MSRLLIQSAALLAVLAALPAQTPTDTAAPKAPATQEPALIDPKLAAAIRKVGIEESEAMRLLQDLTGKVGHRLTGSDNFTKACDWAVAEFEKMGLKNVHKEKWGTWKLAWNRGAWSGRILAPIQLDMYVATEAWTAATPGPVVGKLFKVPADDQQFEAMAKDLKGNFLYGRKPRGELRQRCEEAGIAGWVNMSRGDAKYPTRVRVFGNHRVAMGELADVPKVPDIAVQSDHAEQLEKLLDEGQVVSVEFNIESSFRDGGIDLCNVIAEIPGTEKPDEVVIVCGHLDSWHQAQGCTDNGTGTTSTMEAARILAKVGAKPKRTIRFCLWGGEEQGLLGSAAYVRMHRTEMEKVSAVFNHDTGTNWAAALTVAETMHEPMARVFEPVMELTAPDEDHDGPVFKLSRSPTISGGGGSDHASFIAAGVPGLNWSLKGRSDYFGYTWHSQWDKIDVAIPEYQRHTSTVIALAALGTANLPALLDRSGVARRGGTRSDGASYAAALFDAEMDDMKFTKINKDGRAEKMGVKEGDVLAKVQGKTIGAMHEIFSIAREAEGKDIVFTMQRGNGTVDLKLARDELNGALPFARRAFEAELDGLKFVKVTAGGRGDKLGIKVGDVIAKVDGKALTELAELRGAVGEGEGEDVVITLKRGDGTVDVKAKRAEIMPPRGGRGEGRRRGEGGEGGNRPGGQPAPGGAPGGQSGGGTGRTGNGDR